MFASINDDKSDDFAKLYSPLAAHATRLVQQRFCQNDFIYNIAPHRLHQASAIARLLLSQEFLPEKMYQRTLSGKEKALGADHTSTLDTINNFGVLYSKQDMLEKAEQMYQRALAGFEKALGVDHMSTLETVDFLGVLYQNQGRLNEAEQMYQRALAGREKAVGANHVSTLDTVNNLGVLYSQHGRLDRAEQMFQRVLVGIEKALGADHISTLNTVTNIWSSTLVEKHIKALR